MTLLYGPDVGEQTLAFIRWERMVEPGTVHFVQNVDHRGFQPFQIVAAFENGGATALGLIPRHAQENPCQGSKALCREGQTTEGVAGVGVKAGGDQYELGLKLSTNRIDHLFKSGTMAASPQPALSGRLTV